MVVYERLAYEKKLQVIGGLFFIVFLILFCFLYWLGYQSLEAEKNTQIVPTPTETREQKWEKQWQSVCPFDYATSSDRNQLYMSEIKFYDGFSFSVGCSLAYSTETGDEVHVVISDTNFARANHLVSM